MYTRLQGTILQVGYGYEEVPLLLSFPLGEPLLGLAFAKVSATVNLAGA
jgi:hypothetical protein